MLETIAKYVLLIIGAYLLGGVMFAKLLVKHKNKDITCEGSGNPGTMNMLRNHGVIFGVLTLLLDAFKGVAPSLLGYFLFGGKDGGIVAQTAIYIGGLFAVIGHIFPIYYNFKGGKGVATAIGFAFVAQPLVALGVMVVYFIMFFSTRIGSLSSLVAVVTFVVADTIILIIHGSYSAILFLAVIGTLIFVAHKSNLKRLSNKNENVIDLKAVAQKDVELINNIKEKRNTKKSNKAETVKEEVKLPEQAVVVEVVEEENVEQPKAQNKKRVSTKKKEVKAE